VVHACAGQLVEFRHRTIEVVEAADGADRVDVVGVPIGGHRELLAMAAREAVNVRVADLVHDRFGSGLERLLCNQLLEPTVFTASFDCSA
jgi:hypothetical protein